MIKKLIILLNISLLILLSCQNLSAKKPARERWSIEKAQKWSSDIGWLRGSNFNPSSAINQLETWQAESFDATTINRELGWAQGIGLNVMRVYLLQSREFIIPDGFAIRVICFIRI